MAQDHELSLFDTLQKVGAKPPTVRNADLHAQDSTEVVEDVGHDTEEQKPVASPPATVTLQNLFRHPDAHPLVLDLVLLRHYGPDWLEWEPETLELSIPRDFPTGNVSELNLAKLNACKTLHLVDSFWQRWEVFTWCAMPFNGMFPNFRIMQVPTVGQLLVAVDIANRIREDTAWSDEVRDFMRQIYLHDGVLVPLPPADFFTLHTEFGSESDQIDKLWPDVRASGKAPTGDTLINEQLRRMLHVHQYLEESRARLHKQMELVPHV